MLGVFPDWVYQQAQVALGSGDRLLLFSDGITEAENSAGEEFGEGRLLDLLRQHQRLDATGLRKRIMGAVADFTGGKLQDDATLVVIAAE